MSAAFKCQHLGLGLLRLLPASALIRSWSPKVLPSLRCRTYATSREIIPRVARPSLWHSIVPKFFRAQDSTRIPAKSQRSQEWNPATFFIFIFLLIGSNAIQMLTLRNEYSSFSRKADAKIALLKNVLDRVQRGEQVDVEKALGTGDKVQEQEWREVLQNIEEDNRLWQSKDRRTEKKHLKQEQNAAEDNSKDIEEGSEANGEDTEDSKISMNIAKGPPRFY